ncbi:MAG: hypothetical protein ACRC6T_03575 [Sarcina sp.]
MNNHFLDYCYTNSHCIYIKFNRPMTITGLNGILYPQNYVINTLTCDKAPRSLATLVDSVYSYGVDFVSFKLKKPLAINETLYLYCGHVNDKNVFFIVDPQNFIHDFSCFNELFYYSELTTLSNCSAQLHSNNCLTLKNNNLIKYHKLLPNDFYIEKNGIIYSPYEIQSIDNNSYIFKFKTEIIKKDTEILYLQTNYNCNSTDVLGNKITPNDFTQIEILLPTFPISLSVFSYVDDVLGLALDFSGELKRYDSNDFYFSINGKRYNAKGRERYIKDDIIYFFIYDVFDFDFDYTPVTIFYKNLKTPYTLDKNLKPIQMITKMSSNLLYGILGNFDATNTFGKGILELNFNDYLLKNTFNTTGTLAIWSNFKNTIFSKTIFKHSTHFNEIDDDLITFYIEDLILIFFYTSAFKTPLNTRINDIKVNCYSKKCAIEFSTSDFLFLNSTEYIEVIPLNKIKSYNYTIPMTSIEIPINFTISTDIICEPENQGDSWTLLGKEITQPVTLLVNKNYNSFIYGSQELQTTFLSSLHIKNTAEIAKFRTATINFLNLKGGTLYISLDDAYTFNFDTCEFENTIIL